MDSAARSRAHGCGRRNDHIRARMLVFVLLACALAWLALPRLASAQTVPLIALTSPENGATFHTHDNIVLTASLTGICASNLEFIDFFANSNLLGEVGPGGPYQVVWNDVPAGTHQLWVTCTYYIPIPRYAITGDPSYTSAPIQVIVRDPVPQLELAPGAPALVFTPGVNLSLPIAVTDETGSIMAGTPVTWQLEELAPTSGKFACTGADTPASGSGISDLQGIVNIGFVPGCSSADRRLIVSAPGAASPLSLAISGPDSTASSVVMIPDVTLLAVAPAHSTDLRFRVRTSDYRPVAGAILDFTLSPSAAGTVVASAQTGDEGEANTQLVLSNATSFATLNACLRNQPTVCRSVSLQNSRWAAQLLKLTSPIDGATFRTHDDIELSVEVDPQSAATMTVDLLANGDVIGRIPPGGPYQFIWTDAPAGIHEITARSRISNYGYVYSNSAHVRVRDQVTHLELGPDAPALQFTPGVALTLPVAVIDETGAPVAGAPIAWQVENSALQPRKLDCVAADAPGSGSGITNAQGIATVSFVPGCTSANRRLVVNSPRAAAPLDLILHGPDDRAGSIILTPATALLVLQPNTSTPLTFAVRDAQGAPLGGVMLDFEFTPTDAGSIEARIQVGDLGMATAHLSVTDALKSATLKACVNGRPGVCLSVPVRNAKRAIEEPATAILEPMVQQVLDAPRTQFTNIGNHLRDLRNGGRGLSNDVVVQTGDGTISADKGAGSESSESETRFNAFAAGSIDLGKHDSRPGTRDGFDVTTRGLTLGADVRATPGLVFGAAIGALRSSTNAAGGTRQHARGLSGSLYAQWLPVENAYVNAALNFGGTEFDVRRLACNIQLWTQTSGTQRALSIEAGYSFNRNAMRFTPYLRYENVRAKLDAFTEHGDCIDALSIGGTSLSRSALNAGVSLDRAFSTRSGVWIPSLAVEYMNENQKVDAIFARLLAGGPSIPIQLAKPDRRYATARLSLSWMTSIKAHPLSAFFGFDTDIGRSDYDSRTFMLGLRVPF